MDSKLRDKIAKELYSRYARHCQYAMDTWKDFLPAADSILSLLAPELEKARKYDHIADLISAFPGKQKYPQQSTCSRRSRGL
jgi:hypothetical protein